MRIIISNLYFSFLNDSLCLGVSVVNLERSV